MSAAALGQSDSPSPAPTPSFETTDYRIQSGDVELVGRLFAPRGLASYPLVVLVQGSDYDDANASAYWRIVANTFAKSGIASFSFNKRGVAGSGGTQTDDFDVQARDVAAVCRFASILPGVKRGQFGYFGISQGGWIVPRAITGCPSSFTILVSPAGAAPAQSDEYYLQNQFRAVGMNEAQARSAMDLHRALANYYRSGDGYARAQHLVDAAVTSPWFAGFERIEFRQDVPDGHRLPTPMQLKAIWQSDPERYGFYRDDKTWNEPPSLYETLTAPLLLVYGGLDEDLDVETSISIFQGALRANHNSDVTIRLFEDADHSIQVGPRVLSAYRDCLAAWVLQHVQP